MFLYNLVAVLFLLFSLHIINITAYPMLTIPGLFGSAADRNRIKKSDSGYMQASKVTDADVLELEHLKRNNLNKSHDLIDLNKSDIRIPNDDNEKDVIKHTDDIFPDLENQLVTIAPSAILSTESSLPMEQSKNDKAIYDGQPKQQQTEDRDSQQQYHHTFEAVTVEATPATPVLTKPFYGAARLAFGQNPDVHPVSSTSTTTTTVAAIIAEPVIQNEALSESTSADVHELSAVEAIPLNTVDPISHVTTMPDNEFATHLLRPHSPQMVAGSSAVGMHNIEDTKKPTKTTDLVETLKPAAERRSIQMMSPKMAENLLRRRDGQYSSFDMAQYVFWTGDEAGVARAVDEFIAQGLMSRENALKFLKDIRLGVEYLQRSYTNRIFPADFEVLKTLSPNIHPAPTPRAITSTTEKPFIRSERTVGTNGGGRLRKIDHNSLWDALQELNNNEKPDIDEATGRAKIVEFLYTEYTLEEILYKLAKVMFTQSLTHGSDEAQQELQKLTDFLEREGNLGVISIDLQKKVLHVLLRALSDTLSEHPELLPAAHLNLFNPSNNRLPMDTY